MRCLRAVIGAWLGLLALAVGAAEPARLEYRIEGLEREPEHNLRLHLGEIDATLGSHPQRLQRIVQRALEAALAPYGWYEARCATRLAPPGLQITVEPGPRVVWRKPSIYVSEAARAVPEVAELLAAAPFAPGKPLAHADYDRFRDELLRTVQRLGFFAARYALAELRIDREQRKARAVLRLESGARFVFGEVEIDGTAIDPALLRALAPFRAGEPYDAAKLRRFEQRLRDTGYFHDLTVAVRREAPDRAHVAVSAVDEQKSRYDVGAGFSTDSDLRLRFNRYSPLLNPRGHALMIESALSEPRQTLEATYRIPHTDPLDDIVELTAGLQGKNVEDTDSLTATTGIRHAMKLGKDWSYTYGISAEFERYTIGSESEKDVAYLLPATSISRTVIDPGVDPLHGYSLWTAVDFSDRLVGAPADLLRWRASAKWLTPLGGARTTLLARIDLGAIWTDAFNQVPAALRFYAGGDRSIRGYDYESLAPRDVNGKLLGGRYLSVGSLEISRRVRENWRVAAFVDGGGAFTEKNDDFYQSVGLGLRWLSPIGQIRIDLATPVNDRSNSGVKLHISMGPPL
jgi:translocation and assembly module TamA